MLKNGWGAEGPRKTGIWKKTFGGKYMQWYNIQAKDMATYRPNQPRGQKNVKKKKYIYIVLYNTILQLLYSTEQYGYKVHLQFKIYHGLGTTAKF